MMPTWAAVQEMLALPTNPSLVNGPIEMGFGVQGTSFRVGFLRYGNYWRFNCNWMVGSNVCKPQKITSMETDDVEKTCLLKQIISSTSSDMLPRLGASNLGSLTEVSHITSPKLYVIYTVRLSISYFTYIYNILISL